MPPRIKNDRDNMQDIAIAEMRKEISGFKSLIIEKFNTVIKTQDEARKIQEEQLREAKKTNGRVSKLEQWKLMLFGIWSAIVVIAGVMAWLIWVFIYVTNKP